ncbi:MAG: HDOD domain-containing protein [Candidatus Hydrogenedentes bacterium]|nr:HDOD domain-containing protein [Candidatus Hydrogenedentota bacterium]
MPVEQHYIIQCASCKQRMRVPAGGQAKVYKCVKCGALVKANRATPPPVESLELKTDPKPDAPKTIAEIFVDMGIASQKMIEDVQEKKLPEEKIFETLFRLKMISKDDFYGRMAKKGHAAINLKHFTIERNLTDLVPLEVVRKHWLLPMSSLGKSLTVAMVCPVDEEALRAVKKVTKGMRIHAMLCEVDDFLAAVRKHYRTKDIKQPAAEKEAAAPAEEKKKAAPAEEKEAAAPAPVPAQEESVPDTSFAYPGDEATRKALSELEKLPISSRVMNQVDAVVGVEGEGLRQVVAVVSNSPVLAAITLCTANSAAYGLPKNVGSVPMAIALIGEQAISVLAVSAPKLLVPDEAQWKPLIHFSRHCADIAVVLATECGRVTPSVAYCAGLLHMIGSYALGAINSEEYSEIPPDVFGEKRIHEEKQIFGMGYNEAGALLCEQWHLPDVFKASLRYAMTPEQAGDFRDIATIAYIAANLAGVNSEINQDGFAKCAKSFEFLGIDPTKIAGMLNQSASEAVSAKK